MKAVLAIDTASSAIALALALDGEVIASVSCDGGHDHSKLLLPAIKEILGDNRANLSAIIAVRGPGSYAGLRVGLATAQGLGLSAGVPVAGIPTMEAVIAASGTGDATVIHPAGRGGFAAQDFANGKPTGPLRSAKADDFAGLTLVGEGAGALGGAEISPEARCRSALEVMLPVLATASAANTEAIYLREPHITTPRRPVTTPTN